MQGRGPPLKEVADNTPSNTQNDHHRHKGNVGRKKPKSRIENTEHLVTKKLTAIRHSRQRLGRPVLGATRCTRGLADRAVAQMRWRTSGCGGFGVGRRQATAPHVHSRVAHAEHRTVTTDGWAAHPAIVGAVPEAKHLMVNHSATFRDLFQGFLHAF